jgi:hypothetical protein
LGCTNQNNYIFGIWFGDENWTMKFFEYRIRWWDKSTNGEEVTVEHISQKFLIG